jgi:hypothetical protein
MEDILSIEVCVEQSAGSLEHCSSELTGLGHNFQCPIECFTQSDTTVLEISFGGAMTDEDDRGQAQ